MTARDDGSTSRMGAILRDVQFWIPVVVLVGGIAVLAWVR
jgi:hypothetical protein